MTKNEFYESVKDAVLQKVREEDSTLDAIVSEVVKSNGIVYHGLSFRGESNLQPVIYLDDFFERYSSGLNFEDIVDTVAHIYMVNRKNNDIDVNMLTCFEEAKGNISAAVMNAERNDKLLSELPHVIIEDLAMYYKIDIMLPDGSGMGTVKITNALMNSWGITEDELRCIAVDNTLTSHSVVCKDLCEVVRDIMNDETALADVMNDTGMLVLTNKNKLWGAVLMLPEFKQLEKISDAVEDNLIILPSSKHEVIILREELAAVNGFDFLRNMVREVNENEVSAEDFLSDNIYIYRRESGNLEII